MWMNCVLSMAYRTNDSTPAAINNTVVVTSNSPTRNHGFSGLRPPERNLRGTGPHGSARAPLIGYFWDPLPDASEQAAGVVREEFALLRAGQGGARDELGHGIECGGVMRIVGCVDEMVLADDRRERGQEGFVGLE